jgi:hypothetical protein
LGALDSVILFFFQKKKQKAFVESLMTPTSVKPTQEKEATSVPPPRSIGVAHSSFPEKEAKSVGFAENLVVFLFPAPKSPVP